MSKTDLKEKTKPPVKSSPKIRTKPDAKTISKSGSETVKEKIAQKIPWLFGDSLRKPKLRFPAVRMKSVNLPTPSRNLALIAIYAFLFVLQLGVIYIIYREPISLGAKSDGSAMWIYPSLHDSFIIEAIAASILIFLCSAGFMTLYQSLKYSYDKTFAWRLLLLGAVLVLIGFVALQYMLGVKQGTISQ